MGVVNKYWTASQLEVWWKFMRTTAIGMFLAALIIGIGVGIGFMVEFLSLWFLVLYFPYLVLIIGTFAWWIEEKGY